MNLRLSILLVAVLVIVGGTLLTVKLTETRTANPDQPWLYRMDSNVMVGIAVTNAGKRVEYSRNPGSITWYIQQDPKVPVFFNKWSGIPLLLSGPRVNRVLADTFEDPASYGLEPPQTTVALTQKGGLSLEFHLGYTTPDQSNQYARLVGQPSLFTVSATWGDVINNLVSEPPYPRLYDIEEEALVYVEVSNNGDTTSYGRRNRGGEHQWFILEEEVLVPPEQWEGIPGFLSNPRAYDVLSEKLEDPASYGLDPPLTSAKIGRAGGGLIEFHLGNLTPDRKNRYSRVVGSDLLYAIPEDWANSLIQLAAGPRVPPSGE